MLLTQPPIRAKFFISRKGGGAVALTINTEVSRLGEIVDFFDKRYGDLRCHTVHIKVDGDCLWKIPKNKVELEDAGLM